MSLQHNKAFSVTFTDLMLDRVTLNSTETGEVGTSHGKGEVGLKVSKLVLTGES